MGIQALDAAGEAGAPSDVASIAREYLAAVREAQPEGPYLVGGFCMGGPVAIEMARLLLADGQQVGVVLLDPRMRPPRDLRSLGWTIRRRLRSRSLTSALRQRLRPHPAAGRRATGARPRTGSNARETPTGSSGSTPRRFSIRAADFDSMGVPLDHWRRGLPQLRASPSVEATHNMLFYAPYVDEVAAALVAAGELVR